MSPLLSTSSPPLMLLDLIVIAGANTRSRIFGIRERVGSKEKDQNNTCTIRAMCDNATSKGITPESNQENKMKAKITKIATDGDQFEVEARIIDNSGDDLNWEQIGGYGDEWTDPKIIFDPAEIGGEWIVHVRHCKLSVGDTITDGLEPELCGVQSEAEAVDRGEDYYHARELNAAQSADKFDALRRRGV